MKIVSKYKDFYDYLAQDYDADILYIREAKLKNMTGDMRKLYVKSWYEKTDNSLLPVNIQYLKTYGLKLGDVAVDGVIFGVYPFVYSTPVLLLYGREDEGTVCWGDALVVFPGRTFIEKLDGIEDEKQLSKAISKFCKDSALRYNKSIQDKWIYNRRKLADVEYKVRNIKSFKNTLAKKGKVECREIFDILGSPVFIENSEYVDFYSSSYRDLFYDLRNKLYKNPEIGRNHYLVDLSFNELDPDIIKYWYTDLYDLNTYNYIENFLWSQKHEVASEQTNSEKILSHGFDLKTSFRKM